MSRFLLILISFFLAISSAMALDIVSVENPTYHHILTTPAKKVTFPLSAEDKNLIKSLKRKLKNLGGIGLAAPQVNYSKQIIALYIPEEAKLLRDNIEGPYPMHILINPTYVPQRGTAINYDFESCYSVDSKAGKVPRYNQIQVSYYDESGNHIQQTASGFYARSLQHEIDHLNGILISDRLTPSCTQGTIKEMMALRRAELSPEKRELFDRVMAKKLKK